MFANRLGFAASVAGVMDDSRVTHNVSEKVAVSQLGHSLTDRRNIFSAD